MEFIDSLYEHDQLKDYDCIDVDRVISSLSKDHQKVIEDLFGIIHKDSEDRILPVDSVNKFYGIVLPLIWKSLLGSNISSYREEEQEEETSTRTFESRLIYNEDVNSDAMSERIKQNQLKYDSISKREFKIIRELSSKAKDKNKRVIDLFFGIEDGMCHTINGISRKLRLSPQEVYDIVEKTASKIDKKMLEPYVEEPEVEETQEEIAKVKEELVEVIEDTSNNQPKEEIIPNNGRKIQSIYEYFSDYSKELIDSTIEELYPYEKEHLIKSYGNDLEHPKRDKNFSQKDSKILYGSLLPRIGRILVKKSRKKVIKRKRKIKNIYQLLSPYSKEEIDKVIESLTDEEKKLLKKRYGDDLENIDESIKLDDRENSKFYSKLIPKIKKLLKNNRNEIESEEKHEIQVSEIEPTSLPSEKDTTEFTEEEISNMKDIFVNYIFPDSSYEFSSFEIFIACLLFGCVGGKYFKADPIANFLGIDQEIILAVQKKVLSAYQEYLKQNFEIEETKQVTIKQKK